MSTRAWAAPTKPPRLLVLTCRYAWSAHGTYHNVRYSDDSYDDCTTAQTAFDFDDLVNSTLPFQNWDNAEPQAGLTSSLGSALYVNEVTTIRAFATDADASDIVHLTLIFYGRPHEKCVLPTSLRTARRASPTPTGPAPRPQDQHHAHRTSTTLPQRRDTPRCSLVRAQVRLAAVQLKDAAQ